MSQSSQDKRNNDFIYYCEMALGKRLNLITGMAENL